MPHEYRPRFVLGYSLDIVSGSDHPCSPQALSASSAIKIISSLIFNRLF